MVVVAYLMASDKSQVRRDSTAAAHAMPALPAKANTYICLCGSFGSPLVRAGGWAGAACACVRAVECARSLVRYPILLSALYICTVSILLLPLALSIMTAFQLARLVWRAELLILLLTLLSAKMCDVIVSR